MLNKTIPTLEIKTTGTDLSYIETLHIAIKQRQGDFQTVKSNENIEVDNDTISVSLTQSEMTRLEENDGINIQIIAVGNDGEVSNVKIAWVKRGSRTSHIPSEEGGSGESPISNEVWYPTVSASGDITWTKSATATPPTPRNIKGNKGNDGITPHIDMASGNWFIGTENTGVKARGEDGKPGENGTSPTIGDNGNWYIGFTDTGVKAKGTDGRDGKDGFSPTIAESADNDDLTYKLDITTKEGSFTTPNLMGKDGNSSGGGLTEQEVTATVNEKIQKATSGARIAKNEKGEWGYIPPGTDTVIPFLNERALESNMILAYYNGATNHVSNIILPAYSPIVVDAKYDIVNKV